MNPLVIKALRNDKRKKYVPRHYKPRHRKKQNGGTLVNVN